MSVLEIGYGVAIEDDLFIATASRSGGPGGQHVNKTSTRVTVSFNVDECDSLTEYQKRRILHYAGKRASRDGMIRVVAQQHRSQLKNRDEATERLIAILRDALAPLPVRKQTAIPRRTRERRLEEKKHRSETKRLRRGPVES